ncbi:hypothetical protein GPECTOR_15g496 [Gonium pectorale]|uniref:Uncharacterized protein n=1 Tax=Gonium pectorale TaxID=33097 RepID=A0A150GN87_GONPE|nr:hypothetical protein GPECTOR_15g496 [Gonium pectorale]|eukprot:KXZ50810.1 hypothetical protein GPECTOR_15g496 [Gonium pectorale]
MITTQLLASFPNGITAWGNTSTGTFSVGGEGAATTYRALLRFGDAHRQVPPGAAVEAAELSLSFVNWAAPALVQACFMAVDWSNYENATLRFKSTGWRYSRWNGSASLNWTEPGGWADCSPDVNISFVVPYDGRTSFWPITLQLDPTSVRAWLANNGSANFGLMFRRVWAVAEPTVFARHSPRWVSRAGGRAQACGVWGVGRGA